MTTLDRSMYHGLMTKTKQRTCANPKCRRPLTGRSNQVYCSTRCSAAAAYARKTSEAASEPQVPLCHACAYPTDRQAEPVAPRGVLRRHPFRGKRPTDSGWCVDPACPCKHCRPENQGGAARPKAPTPSPEVKNLPATCPLPRIADNPMLVTAHKRAVRDGMISCSCVGSEGSVS